MLVINFNSRFTRRGGGETRNKRNFYLHVLYRSSCTDCRTCTLLLQNEGPREGGPTRRREGEGRIWEINWLRHFYWMPKHRPRWCTLFRRSSMTSATQLGTYRRFETACWTRIPGSSCTRTVNTTPPHCLQTSGAHLPVIRLQIPKSRIPQLHRCESLKTRIVCSMNISLRGGFHINTVSGHGDSEADKWRRKSHTWHGHARRTYDTNTVLRWAELWEANFSIDNTPLSYSVNYTRPSKLFKTKVYRTSSIFQALRTESNYVRRAQRNLGNLQCLHWQEKTTITILQSDHPE